MARLKEKYLKEVIPALIKDCNISNKMAVPKLEKIVINMGVGKAIDNKKRLEQSVKELAAIAGQRPVITKAKKSVAGFKLREGMEIGCKVTLRGNKMYEFMDRLINAVIPRIRDFRGLSRVAFDKAGNYSIGLADQSIFPEVNLDEMEFTQGMDITFVIENGSPKSSYELLKHFSMPFKAEN